MFYASRNAQAAAVLLPRCMKGRDVMKMKITWLAAGLFAAAAIFVSGSAAAECPEGKIQVVTTNPAGKTLVKCVSDNAEGGMETAGDNAAATIIIASFTPLGSLPDEDGSFGLGVSADGSVAVGSSYFGSLKQQEAVRWTESGGMVGLDFLPGGSVIVSLAEAASADGSVVVGRSSSADGTQAFRWTESGMVGLDFLPGGTYSSSYAWGVSADGWVVVGESSSADTAFGREAFRWTADEGMVGLDFLPGGTNPNSNAYGVSADGSVVVGDSSSADGLQAFRWTADEGMVGLGLLRSAQAVSADGSVVVGFSAVAAALWTEADGVQLIRDLLEAQGIDLTGWHLDEARAVSADGRTIVGLAQNPDGNREGWVATLPLP
jgi:probable HAF family extracellular repeat protein